MPARPAKSPLRAFTTSSDTIRQATGPRDNSGTFDEDKAGKVTGSVTQFVIFPENAAEARRTARAERMAGIVPAMMRHGD
jgi:hypothetical protein